MVINWSHLINKHQKLQNTHSVLILQNAYSVLGFTAQSYDLKSAFLLHQLLLIINY